MKKNKISNRFKIILSLLLLFPLLSFGQESDKSFLQSSDQKEITLKPEQEKRFENLKNNRLHKPVQFVKVGNLSKISKANRGALPIKIPGINNTFVARPTKVEFISETNYVWKGTFLRTEGSITLICQNGDFIGHIEIKDKLFEIHTFDKGKNILIEFNKEELSKSVCGNFETHDSHKKTQQVELQSKMKAAPISTTTVVRVLFLYTNAASRAVHIGTTVSAALDQMNEALINSDVRSNLYMSLAGIEGFAFVERQYLLDEDVELLLSDTTVQNLRNSYQADIVVLLTDGNYLKDINGVYEYVFGRVASFGPNVTEAYAIIEADQATASYTFAHEVGHLFGGRHQNDFSEPYYEKGYSFKTGWIIKTDRTTLMYYKPGDYILHYSNPEIEYKDVATGESFNHDVARKLREEAATVAAFRPYIPPLSVYITGIIYGDNDGTYTWTSTVANGTLPYTYVWHYSLDGFNYIGTLGTASSLTAQLPQDNDLHLKLTVTSSDGQTADAYHTTVNMDANYDPTDPPDPVLRNNGNESNDIDSENEDNSSFFMNVYPNPVRDISTINYFVNEKETIVIINIVDINGRTIKSFKYLNQNMGKYSVTFDSKGLKSGVYFCQISMDNKRSIQKFIIE